VNAAKLRLVVERTNAERPDLVVLLGDYVIKGVAGGRFMTPEAMANELAGLRGPLGVVAVLGNHDWWYDGPRVQKALVGAGFRVLDNEAVVLERGGRRFWVAGIGDLWAGSPDPARALATVPDDEPVLALTHNPDVFPRVPARVALTLAGHTHGGQVRLPLLGAPIVPSQFRQRYAAGLVEEEGRRIFVTPGIGTSIVPVRLGVPPEISVVVLSRATSPPPR
jgi:predicted MPP superfamily phosphohydrolase